MTVVGTTLIVNVLFGSPNWLGPLIGVKKLCFQKHRVREGPWRFREGFREGKKICCKNSGNVKVREGSVKPNVKGIGNVYD